MTSIIPQTFKSNEKRKSVYWLWRRNDGYVAATKGAFPPRGWVQENGTEVSFEMLGAFDEWEDCYNAWKKEIEKQ